MDTITEHETFAEEFDVFKGYVVAGFGKEFFVCTTENARRGGKDPAQFLDLVMIEVEARIQLVRLSRCQTEIIIICDGLMTHYFDAQSLLNKTTTQPSKSRAMLTPQPEVGLSQYLLDPSDEFPVFLMLLEDGRLFVVDDSSVARWQREEVTSASFSATGGQIAWGTRNGDIHISGVNGEVGATIPLPSSLKGSHIAHHLHWVSDEELFAVYWGLDTNPPVMFMIHLKSAVRFTRLGEVYLEFEAQPDNTRFSCCVLHKLAQDVPSLVLLAASQCTELIVLACRPDGEWRQVFLEESFQVVLPFNPSTTIVPGGIALDLTAKEPIQNLFSDLPNMPSVPVLYLLNTLGELQMYECISKQLATNITCPEATRAADLSPATPPVVTEVSPAIESSAVTGFEGSPSILLTSAPVPIEEHPPVNEQAPAQSLAASAIKPSTTPEQQPSITLSSEARLPNASIETPQMDSSSKHLEVPLTQEILGLKDMGLSRFLQADLEQLSFSEILSLAQNDPKAKSFASAPPHPSRQLELPPYSASTAEYGGLRKLANRFNFTVATVGLNKDRWDKHVADTGDINALSKDLDALGDKIKSAHRDALSFHKASVEWLNKLKTTAKDLAYSEQLISRHRPVSHDASKYAETEPAYQAMVTGALVNLEIKLASFQNILNLINQQYFSRQSLWTRVLEEPALGHFLATLQALHQSNLQLQKKISHIRSYNSKINFIYKSSDSKSNEYFTEAIAASASIAIPASAVAQAHHLTNQQTWLDDFQAEFVKLHAS
ncbi:hypothetical protein L0F63_005370 [Massospora cicadina]|nr:hypothetical protein L0F63_005370 [Massospora cicadina]